MVTTFAGDDRVQPFESSVSDIWERLYVPDDQQPLSVITQATPAAGVGEEFDDAALVQGSKIPKDAYLVFRAYGPHDPEAEPVCETPFFASEKIPVTQAGIYRSGKTSVDRAGQVYWVETLYGKDGKVLAEGRCGAPGETTVVTGAPPKVPPTPPTPETPDLPKLSPELAVTGGAGFPWLIAAGGAVALLAAGVTLWFGRRLALSREQGGYVREEDEGIEELMND